MKKIFNIFVFCLVLSILVNSAYAQFWGIGERRSGGAFNIEWWWTDVFGLDEDWMRLPAFLYNFVIPFIAIFAISLGIIRQLRIFHRNPGIEAVIAFCMAFATLPSHAFVTFVSWTLAIMGGWSYIVFVVLFFIGTGFTILIRWRGWSGEYAAAGAYVESLRSMQDQVMNIRDRREELSERKIDLYNKLSSGSIRPTTYSKKIAEIDKEIARLDAEESRVTARLRELKRSAP